MKNRIIIPIIFFFLLLAMASCKKENPQPTPPPAPATGTIYLKNTKPDPYIIYLDGTNMGVLAAGNTSTAYSVSSSVGHTVKAEQYTGFVLYPTVFTDVLTLNPGATVTWAF